MAMVMVFAMAAALFGSPSRADESAKAPGEGAAPPATWATLEQQSKDLMVAVHAHDVASMHKLDHAVATESAELEKNEPTLPAAQRGKLATLLTDIAKQAARAHHDGHTEKWADAADAQKQFAADLDAAKAILSSGN